MEIRPTEKYIFPHQFVTSVSDWGGRGKDYGAWSSCSEGGSKGAARPGGACGPYKDTIGFNFS